MITAGTKVKIIGVGKKDAAHSNRKALVNKVGTVGDEGLRQWKDSKTFYGPVHFNPADLAEKDKYYEYFWFHSVRVKII